MFLSNMPTWTLTYLSRQFLVSPVFKSLIFLFLLSLFIKFIVFIFLLTHNEYLRRIFNPQLIDLTWKTEAVFRRCSVKKLFLKISQNSQKNTCARASFLIKLQAWVLQLYYKRGSSTGVFLWIFQNSSEHLFSASGKI